MHRSDCATHNAPAFPFGECDCGIATRSNESVLGDAHDAWARHEWDRIWSSNGRNGQGRREAGRQTRALIADLHRRLSVGE